MPHAAQHEPHFQTLNIYWGEIATPETINRENVGGNGKNCLGAKT